jgi:DNA repair protein RecO
MKQIVTQGIVLARTNYGEADRILTLLSPDHGKLRLMAKGVRKSKSKLAGGIELFSISDITFMRGRSEVGTLLSARLKHHFGNIVKDIDRTMLGYELIKQINRATEDEPEPEYFDLLELTLAALNDEAVTNELIQTWFSAQLLRRGGHTPNLQTDKAGSKLKENQAYTFSFDDMSFAATPVSRFSSQHIKLLRLLFSSHTVQAINKVQGIENLLIEVAPLIKTMRNLYIRV